MQLTRRSGFGAAVLIACGIALIVVDIPFWLRLIGYGAAGAFVGLAIFRIRRPRVLLSLALLMVLAACFGAGLGWTFSELPTWMLYVVVLGLIVFEAGRRRRRRRGHGAGPL